MTAWGRYVGMHIAGYVDHGDGTTTLTLRHHAGVPEAHCRHIVVPTGPLVERVPGYRRDLDQAQIDIGDDRADRELHDLERNEPERR